MLIFSARKQSHITPHKEETTIKKKKINIHKTRKPTRKAIKTNRNHATGEIKTPLNEDRDETKEKKQEENKKEKHHLVQPPIQCKLMSSPTSVKCFLDFYKRVPHRQQAVQNIK